MTSCRSTYPSCGGLIADQFPKWAHLPIMPVNISDHDNRTFRLGTDMSVRIPSAQRYAQHVETERIWLPRLAPHLPLPIPTPLAIGKPVHGCPWIWSVNRWLDGENATIVKIDDLSLFARDLANFLNRLRSIGTTDAPKPAPTTSIEAATSRCTTLKCASLSTGCKMWSTPKQ